MPSPKLASLLLTDSERGLEALVRKRMASGPLALRARILLTCAEIVLAIERTSGLGLSPDRVTWTADADPYAGHDMGARWSAEARKAVVLKICSPLAPESHTAHASLRGQCRPSGHRTARMRSLTIKAT